MPSSIRRFFNVCVSRVELFRFPVAITICYGFFTASFVYPIFNTVVHQAHHDHEKLITSETQDVEPFFHTRRSSIAHRVLVRISSHSLMIPESANQWDTALHTIELRGVLM